MKLGPVLTYKDVDEAQRLVGKKVVASDFYAPICDDDTACDCVHDTLKAVHADKVCPFECNIFYGTQFIREILDEAKYEPYDLSDPKVRDSLRGRWYVGKRTGNEYQVYCFYKPRREDGCWEIAPNHSAEDFFESFTWLDGTPCGQLVHAGEGHVEGNASERRVDG